MDGEEGEPSRRRVAGRIKWYDPGRGFGFILDAKGGADILIHANVLRNFGQGSVAEGAGIEVMVQDSRRGPQAALVLRILPPDLPEGEGHAAPPIAAEDLALLPLEPARVKWFDKVKGYGFANVFGRPEDVFVHMDVVRRSGFGELAAGEAVCLRVMAGRRGRMAVQVVAWDTAQQPEE
ncbi:MAG: CspA family cold shock protein [Rhodobacteraceae bacterium]|nr:CspA family cold shock protein [Paracoccaceae bacterium]